MFRMNDRDLEPLVEEVVGLSKAPGNLALQELWERFYAFEEPDKVPVKAWMNDSGWARYLGYSLIDIFKDPKEYLAYRLEVALHQRKLIPDDAPVGTSISIAFGPTVVPSLFGIEPVFRADTIPWPGDSTPGTPLIRGEEDLDRLDYPDFYKSGLMPEVHRFYEALQDLAGPDLKVVFPALIGHPWQIAEYMRGMTNLLMDIHRNPGLVHRLLTYIVESMERLAEERARFLGIEQKGPGGTGGDAVDCNKMSPESYLEFIRPYEQRLAESFGGEVRGYHSCGNLAPILEHIAELPGMERIHCSPWTDFGRAVEVCRGRRLILEKRMHAVAEVLRPTEEEMESTIRDYLRAGSGTIMQLAASLDGDTALDKLQMWVRAARNALGERSFYASGPLSPLGRGSG
jgi:uroporphyrinogen-III decarboxylase